MSWPTVTGPAVTTIEIEARLAALVTEAVGGIVDARDLPSVGFEDEIMSFMNVGQIALCTRDTRSFLGADKLHAQVYREMMKHRIVQTGASSRYAQLALVRNGNIVTLWSPRDADHSEIPLSEGW